MPRSDENIKVGAAGAGNAACSGGTARSRRGTRQHRSEVCLHDRNDDDALWPLSSMIASLAQVSLVRLEPRRYPRTEALFPMRQNLHSVDSGASSIAVKQLPAVFESFREDPQFVKRCFGRFQVS